MLQPSEPVNPSATILWWLRRPGHERQLTDCLGELARVDRAVARGLAASVLEAARSNSHGRQASARARSLLGVLPHELTCSREETTGALVVRERSWWREEKSRSGRLDWVFHPPGQERTKRDFQLAVEVKVGAGLASHQLADYRVHLAREPEQRRGVIVLARSFPDRGLLSDETDDWCGVVLWEQVLPLLKEVVPEDDALAVQWPLLLEILERREDLGTEQVKWANVTAADPSQAMRRLGEYVRRVVEPSAQAALARRADANAPGAFGSLALRTSRRGEVTLSLRIRPGDKKPAAEIRLRAQPDGIAVTADVYPLPRPRGPLTGKGKQRHDEALRRLTTSRPPYAAIARGLSRTKIILADGDDVQRSIAASVDQDLHHIVQSGILDEDLRYAL